MRYFAQESKATKKAISVPSTAPGPAHLGQRHEVTSIFPPPDRSQASHPVTTSAPLVIGNPAPLATATTPAFRPSVVPHSVYETVSTPGRPLETALRREMSA